LFSNKEIYYFSKKKKLIIIIKASNTETYTSRWRSPTST